MPKRTPSGKETKLEKAENALKKEYPNNPNALYGTLNKIGLMRGSRATKKGREAARRK